MLLKRSSWAIVGGGIHGVHLAVRLIEDGDFDPEDIVILDPAPRLLHEWRRRVDAVGMTYLRSPCVHNLAADPWDLYEFKHKQNGLRTPPFRPPYDRPSVELFDRHCDDLIGFYGLTACHEQKRVSGIERHNEKITLECDSGETVLSERAVLCIGGNSDPLIPSWAEPFLGPKIQHLFASTFSWNDFSHAGTFLIIGGGISAAQAAIRAANAGKQVTILARHEVQENQFDSDPGWVGPKFMRGYLEEKDLAKRRVMIQKARHRGSMPPDVHNSLRDCIKTRKVEWIRGEVSAISGLSGRLKVELNIGRSLAPEVVILATGFQSRRPGGTLVDSMLRSLDLPVADCGFPIVDPHLRWAENVFVTGPLAELELGPAARNITGARRAAERILAPMPITYPIY